MLNKLQEDFTCYGMKLKNNLGIKDTMMIIHTWQKLERERYEQKQVLALMKICIER